MIRTKWTIRLGAFGAVASVAVLASSAATTSAAQAGITVTGVHANEEFCKTMIRQVELGAEYMKHEALIPDMTKRAKYFADQRELNATLVKTAPASLATDIVGFTRNANAMDDARRVGKEGDREQIKAAARAMTSPEQLAAARRMNEYCGVKFTTSK